MTVGHKESGRNLWDRTVLIFIDDAASFCFIKDYPVTSH